MITERMLEYLILAYIDDSICCEKEFYFKGKKYDMVKLRERKDNLMQEFLDESYVINSDSKE